MHSVASKIRCNRHKTFVSARLPRFWGIAFAAVVAATVAACGSDREGASTTVPAGATTSTSTVPPASTNPTATAPEATAPPTDATGPGAGDEEPIRVPARFEVRGGRLTPSEVRVPAFLTVELEVRSVDGRPHTILLAAPRAEVLAVPAGGQASVTVPGLKRGRWELSVDGRPAGAIVAGSEPGP
jgi:hypothetical protein